MNEAAELDECRDQVRGGRFPSRLRVEKSNGGGDGMDEILKRLGAVESTVSEIRAHVSGIAAMIPLLATKADVSAGEAAMIKWTVSTIIATTGLTIAIVRYFH